MKTIQIDQPVNLSLLGEELFEAFPEWAKPDPLGRGWDVTDATVAEDAVTFPDETDENEVRKVIDQHSKDMDSTNQATEKSRAVKLESAKNKLRALGLDDEEIEVLVT